jgi:hypothetical protein
MKRTSCESFAPAPTLVHSARAPTIRRLLVGAAALVTATFVLLPEDASAQWRGGWRGLGWGGGYGIGWGGYRPYYRPLAGLIAYAAPIIAVAPYALLPPVSYGYAAPYPSYGGGYYGGGYYAGGYYGGYYGGGYYGYRRCVTDEGYGRYRGCDR